MMKNIINSNTNSKNGFTLAEILIAVALVGALGAFLVPAITQSTPEQNKLKLKSAHRMLETAIGTMINSSDAYPANDDTSIIMEKVNQDGESNSFTYQRGFNYTKKFGNDTTNKFCYFLTNSITTVGQKTCPLASEAGTWGNFKTSDGAYWQVYNLLADSANDTITKDTTDADSESYSFPISDDNYYAKIVVDLDGKNKGENCSTDSMAGSAPYSSVTAKCAWASPSACTKMPDTFIFGVRYDGRVQIGSSDNSDYCALTILTDPSNNMKF